MSVVIKMNIEISADRYTNLFPTREKYPLHTHNNYEILCFISGNADYSVEGNRYKLVPGDIMIMRKNESHHLILKSDVPYERILINFDFLEETGFEELLAPFNNRDAGEKNLYRPSILKDSNLIFCLKKLSICKNKTRKICWLLAFLEELNCVFESKNAYEKPTKDKATHIISYINAHLTEDISLASLAEEFYISQNHLNRLFKESTGTTLWDYVTVKRLVLARDKLSLGEKPTEIYKDSGFNDYATFYRAYKKYFGTSPKAAKVKI